MHELTPRQQEVFDYIKGFTDDKGIPPTRKEIANKFNFGSVNTVQCHLAALQKKGVINVMAGTARGIQVKQRELKL